jgi:hypothetical protein
VPLSQYHALADLSVSLAVALLPSSTMLKRLHGVRSGGSNGALIGGIVSGVVGGVLVLAAAVAAVLLWRKRKRRRAGLAPGKLSADSSFSAAASGNSVKPRSSVELAVGSSRGEPLRDMYGGIIAGSAGYSDSDSGGTSAQGLFPHHCHTWQDMNILERGCPDCISACSKILPVFPGKAL